MRKTGELKDKETKNSENKKALLAKLNQLEKESDKLHPKTATDLATISLNRSLNKRNQNLSFKKNNSSIMNNFRDTIGRPNSRATPNTRVHKVMDRKPQGSNSKAKGSLLGKKLLNDIFEKKRSSKTHSTSEMNPGSKERTLSAKENRKRGGKRFASPQLSHIMGNNFLSFKEPTYYMNNLKESYFAKKNVSEDPYINHISKNFFTIRRIAMSLEKAITKGIDLSEKHYFAPQRRPETRKFQK